MTIKFVKAYTATLFNTLMLGEKFELTPRDRVTVLSNKPIHVEILDLPAQDAMQRDMIGRIVAGAGMTCAVKLTSEGALAMLEGDSGVGRFVGGAKLMSSHREAHQIDDVMPEGLARAMFGADAELEALDFTAEQALEALLETAKQMAALNLSYGCKDEEVKRLAEAATPSAALDVLRDDMLLARLGKASPLLAKLIDQNDGGAQVMHKGLASDSQFVAVLATDFTHRKDGREVMLRVEHVESPRWEPRKEGDPDGVLGRWLFERAAVPEATVIDGRKVATFSVVNTLAVVMTEGDAINPSGRVAIPYEVWKELAPAQAEPALMTMAEAEAFNAQSLAQSLAAPTTRN